MTEAMPEESFMRYVRTKDRQFGPTSDKLMRDIRDDFFETHMPFVAKDQLDFVWNHVKKRLRKNSALALFTYENEGAISDYFFPWLMAVATSPSMALEMSYGAGMNLDGEWDEYGYLNDEIEPFVKNDPTFVYNRERQLFIADLVTSVRNATLSGAKSKVIDFGAGRMAWARRHGFRFVPEKQVILAFDKDPTIKPEELFGKRWSRTGIVYRKGDLVTELHNADCANANLIILGGVASYYPLEVFKNVILKSVYNLLQTGGAFFFDLQLDCPYYQRSVKVFDWPEMKLAASATVAIDTVEQMRKELWKDGMRFSAEYALDTYNEYPTSVMVVLTKV